MKKVGRERFVKYVLCVQVTLWVYACILYHDGKKERFAKPRFLFNGIFPKDGAVTALNTAQ
jgi:hypothetical protein